MQSFVLFDAGEALQAPTSETPEEATGASGCSSTGFWPASAQRTALHGGGEQEAHPLLSSSASHFHILAA